jgi:ABC-2 type transport system ATP-binding protein
VQDHIAAIRNGGHAVLLATHDMAEAERLCDRIAVIAQGRIVVTGAPRDLIAASGAATLEDMILTQTARA